jgi:hypothetical protein
VPQQVTRSGTNGHRRGHKHRQENVSFKPAMQNRIKQEYAYQVIHRQQRVRGQSVERQRLRNGEIEATIAEYR